MKSQFSLTNAIIGGITATVIMTLFTFMGAMMNIKMDIPAMLASMFGGNLLIGWIMHFMIGIMLAIGYAVIFYNNVSISPNWFKGAVYGILPWLMAQIIVMPMMNVLNGMSFTSGLFSGSFILAFASLIGHLVYGAVLGSIYKVNPQLKTA